jgi:hypothetical protein
VQHWHCNRQMRSACDLGAAALWLRPGARWSLPGAPRVRFPGRKRSLQTRRRKSTKRPLQKKPWTARRRALESCCGVAMQPWTPWRTCDSACAQWRRAVLVFLETAGEWRQCHLRPGMASLAFLETADLALLEVRLVPAWRRRLCSVPSHTLCQVAEHKPKDETQDETPAPCGPRHLCCRWAARSSGSLARARGHQLRLCWTRVAPLSCRQTRAKS